MSKPTETTEISEVDAEDSAVKTTGVPPTSTPTRAKPFSVVGASSSPDWVAVGDLNCFDFTNGTAIFNKANDHVLVESFAEPGVIYDLTEGYTGPVWDFNTVGFGADKAGTGIKLPPDSAEFLRSDYNKNSSMVTGNLGAIATVFCF